MGKKKSRSSIRDKVRQRAQDQENEGGQSTWLNLPEDSEVEFFSPKKGTNILDIVPYEVSAENHKYMEPGDLWYEKTIWVHFGIGPEEKTIICPLKTAWKPCPVCQYISELSKEPELTKKEEKQIQNYKPKQREMFNVIDLNDDEDDDGETKVKLFTFSYHNFGKVLEEEIREDDTEEYGKFADLEGGYTLKVRFKEASFKGNKYFETSRIDFEEREEDYDEDILESTLDLDDCIIILSYEDIESIFLGLDSDEDEDEEEEKSSKKKKKKDKKKGKKKKRQEEEEPEEPELAYGDECPEDDDLVFGQDYDEYECCDDCDVRDDCDDAEKPKKKKKKKKKKR